MVRADGKKAQTEEELGYPHLELSSTAGGGVTSASARGCSSRGMTEDTEEPEEGEAYREWAHDDENDDDEEEEEGDAAEGGDKKPKKEKAKGTYILPTLLTSPTGGKHKRRTIVHPWSKINLALTVGSFAYAATTTFLQVPLNYYIIQDLKLDGRATNVASTTMLLPQALQLAFGLLSDCVPIYGQRRKPYIIMGWSMNFVAMAALAAVGKPGINSLLSLLFLISCGNQLVDIAAKALIVQRSRHETEEDTGYLLVAYAFADALGDVVGNLLGTFLYKDSFRGHTHTHTPSPSLNLGQIALCNLLFAVLLMGPALFYLYDKKICPRTMTRPIKEELRDVWRMVQRKSLLLPMMFVAVYKIFWLPNSAWDLFLIKGLDFSEWKMGILGLTFNIVGALGAYIYQNVLLRLSWRVVFGWSLVIMACMDLSQLLLLFGVTAKWGWNDLGFMVGLTAIGGVAEGFHELPLQIMYLGFCPPGAEGTTMATLQTFTSLAVMCSNNLGLLALRIWPVDAPTLAMGEWSGLWRLTLLTTASQLWGFVFLPFLPRNVHEQRERQAEGTDRRSFWGGVAFVTFVFAALVWTVVLDMVTVAQSS